MMLLPTALRQHRNATRCGGLVCLVFALVACKAQVPATDEAGEAEPRYHASTQLLSGEGALMPTNGDPALPPERLLAPVLADASRRSGVAVGELVVVDAWHGTWSDGSLGCPQPGMLYTQALVPGWQLILKAGERTLDYRLSDRGAFLLCPQGIAGEAELRKGQ